MAGSTARSSRQTAISGAAPSPPIRVPIRPPMSTSKILPMPASQHSRWLRRAAYASADRSASPCWNDRRPQFRGGPDQRPSRRPAVSPSAAAGSPMPDENATRPARWLSPGSGVICSMPAAPRRAGSARMQSNQGRIEAVFLTHFHSDHIDGLGESDDAALGFGGQRQAAARSTGRGCRRRLAAGFTRPMRRSKIYRIAISAKRSRRRRAPAVSRDRSIPRPPAGARYSSSEPDLEIVAFEVDHGPIHRGRRLSHPLQGPHRRVERRYQQVAGACSARPRASTCWSMRPCRRRMASTLGESRARPGRQHRPDR